MFTQEQINQLKANKNVIKCSSKSITYKKKFKIWAVKKYFDEGYNPKMIFEEAGFNVKILGKRPKNCLLLWRNKYNKNGEKGLLDDNRGKHRKNKKKIQFKNDKEKIRYLEAKIAYMDAENDFLAKLRGLKRE